MELGTLEHKSFGQGAWNLGTLEHGPLGHGNRKKGKEQETLVFSALKNAYCRSLENRSKKHGS